MAKGLGVEGLVQVVQELSLARDVASVQEIARRAAGAIPVADRAALLLLQALADTTIVALTHAQALETDQLTGLLNRRGFLERAEAVRVHQRRHGGFGQVLFLDIDGLKAVNDERGHEAGDDLIRRATGAVMSVVRDSDVVGRWGGDELVVFATGSTQRWPLMDRIVSEADADMYLRRSFARATKPGAAVPRQPTRLGR